MSNMWSGTYIPVGAADIYFNSFAISTLKEKQVVLREQQSRGPDLQAQERLSWESGHVGFHLGLRAPGLRDFTTFAC